jgi:methylated-DNA-[protein]-cysteine S-methyltransferase
MIIATENGSLVKEETMLGTKPVQVIDREDSLVDQPGLEVSIFSTAIGYMGTIWTDQGLVATRVGYVDQESVEEALLEFVPLAAIGGKSEIAQRLSAYAKGKRDSFLDVPLDLRFVTGGNWTPFRGTVTQLCREIPSGQMVSYLDLAEQAGAPRAARAVGTVMAKNPFPIVVPCHRVIGSGGGLGGYSAPTGLDFKRRLHALES